MVVVMMDGQLWKMVCGGGQQWRYGVSGDWRKDGDDSLWICTVYDGSRIEFVTDFQYFVMEP